MFSRATSITILVMALWLAPAFAAVATATGRDPTDIPLRSYGVILGAALLGGLVSWYGKVRRGEVDALSLHHLIGELATSAFAGLMVFWLLDSYGVDQRVIAAAAGIFGHMGAGGISLLERWAKARFAQASPPAGSDK